MTPSEKVAYLKGLAEGLDISADDKNGKLLLAVIDALDSFAASIEALEVDSADMADELDSLGDDVSFIEEFIFDAEDDYDEDDDESFCRGSCCGCDDEADYEVTCPQCGEVVPVYEDDLSFGNIICPGCGETLEFDFDETDEPDGED
ncbi:MAG: hypothetical protein Q4C93_00960 [Clostridia bacterium]|nr:hypothetical protein [Clostridia bacterium]